MNKAWRSFKVNVADEGEEPVWKWVRYTSKAHRNACKAYRRNRKVAGHQTTFKPKRMRHYRPLGSDEKTTRLEKLRSEVNLTVG